ncbi:hypothetical protein UPYG_G00168010 [Umbra pygmaea]|uniref:Uncharacterized protein n=1 Tax=Umbra pygmaea TaxID=75934 RepID=A0ABD0XAV3_UMBPY
MHSGTLESAGSPRKRTLSRGVSEDESLRNIIKETDSSARRLTRSDSRVGTPKKRSESQSEDDPELTMELPDMVELQASYEEVLQELRGLELQRETLLFQVDILQDALEGAEEMLAEAQREASHAAMELEREREAKRKLEDTVHSLQQTVERLGEERNSAPAMYVKEKERQEDMAGQQTQLIEIKQEVRDNVRNAPRDEHCSAQDAALSIIQLDSASPAPTNGLSFKKGEEDLPSDSLMKPPALQNAWSGSSVDSADVLNGTEDRFSLKTRINKVIEHLGLGSRETASGQGESGRDRSPERSNDTDSISNYEDAYADTPELDEHDGPRLPHDEGSPVDDNEEVDLSNSSEPKNPNDSCILS